MIVYLREVYPPIGRIGLSASLELSRRIISPFLIDPIGREIPISQQWIFTGNSLKLLAFVPVLLADGRCERELVREPSLFQTKAELVWKDFEGFIRCI
jgi:hypothetical protein